MKRKAYLYIMLAAALWGGTGVFVRILTADGFSPIQIAVLRVSVSMVLMILYLLITDPKLLRIDWRDWGYFFGTGILSLSFFNICYFTAIQLSTLAVAAVLLYTAPMFVMLLSVLIFHETMTRSKLMALAMTFMGCVLVTGIFAGGSAAISPLAILTGIGAGFGYGLYSIFGKFALAKYDPATVSVYTFIFGFFGIVPFAGMHSVVPLLLLPKTWACALGTGILCCILPYLFYSKGLAVVEPSRAAILATVEPVVAAILGIMFFHEMMTWPKLLGIALILAAILVLNRKTAPQSMPQSESV